MDFRHWSKEEFEAIPKPCKVWYVTKEYNVPNVTVIGDVQFTNWQHCYFGDIIPTPEVRIVERPPELTEQRARCKAAGCNWSGLCCDSFEPWIGNLDAYNPVCGKINCYHFRACHASPKADAVSVVRDELIEALEPYSTAWHRRFELLGNYFKAERDADQERAK